MEKNRRLGINIALQMQQGMKSIVARLNLMRTIRLHTLAKTVIITHLTESAFIQKKTQDELLTERLMTSNTGYQTLMIFCPRILFRR